jgi:hypothetical protein
MRQITKQAVNKFNNNESFNKDNTRVIFSDLIAPTTKLFLHDNLIAYKKYSSLIISNCGWFSNTTKERLNGLLDSIGFDKIYQKNFEWFLADKKWNGNPVKILKNNNWEYIN